MLKDSEQRLQATDPRRSFIVQAPAGSGKTELLTQRYLRLLSIVQAPEQIVALTFTRKAASEMRERILAALSRAEEGLPPTSPHQALTQQLASEALQRSRNLNWQLLKQPSRLKVITIDSLCQTLIQAIPFHEQQIPYAQISENPAALYQLAVRACINDILAQTHLHSEIQLLLNHLDNRLDKLMQLLCDLLATREQWLSILYSTRHQSKEIHEQALAAIVEHELTVFIESVPEDYQNELCALSSELAIIEANPDSRRYALRDWYDFIQLNQSIAASLAALLLTSEDKLRKSFDHHVGLKRGICPNDQYDRLKSGSKILLENLADHPEFLKALIRVKNLPSPVYEQEQWEVLQALLTLLPLLAAHLHLIFSQANEVDFTAVAQQAVLALGEDEENPTDLALYLDNAIHHLLIDEFQDTSIQQYQLLSKLVQGWLPNEGKTLFVVGDPMQSIYRFRQAEVGLFLKARQHGIGPIALESLELCCNFRSTSTLVNWVNTQFQAIFPLREDIESGAVTFHPSETTRQDDNSQIEAYQLSDKHQEAEFLSELIIRQLHNYPQDTVAILVRSRSQLSAIVKLLRKKEVPFQGIEIEKLAGMAHIQDVWSLTQALLMPANRIAWLAFLRSPWCGLELTDLQILANFDKKKSLYFALANNDKTPLSKDGLIRTKFIYTVMHQALAERHQQSLADWVIGVIEQLHGKFCLNEKELADLDQFFNLLTKFDQQGLIANLTHFENELKQLYSQKITPARLQIMTIHKSKGLEFDCVILPGLGNKAQQRDKPLLRWMKLPTQHEGNLHLLSPVRAAYHQQCLLYDYVGNVAAEKDHYEQQRLLYVAVTRAKKRLFLFDYHESGKAGTFRDLLANQTFLTQELGEKNEVVASNLIFLKRLPLDYYQQDMLAPTLLPARAPRFQTGNLARQTGVITHELLQWICDHHPVSIELLPWGFIGNRFRSAGFTGDEYEQAISELRKQITVMMSDPVGQWLIKKHLHEHNEYELLSFENDQVVTRIIDRTFYDNGECWVIDFKTGKEDDATQLNHTQQVNEYAELIANTTNYPIQCGVYYLATGFWLSWSFQKTPVVA